MVWKTGAWLVSGSWDGDVRLWSTAPLAGTPDELRAAMAPVVPAIKQGGRLADALENALDCSRDGDTFTCDETLLAKFAVSGMDAELLVTVEVTGTLTSSQRITADETIRQSCAGADCAAVIADQALTLPCEYSFSFTGASPWRSRTSGSCCWSADPSARSERRL